ncbi:hypothetical protein I316_06902 [Kwoniella heveanensis BCC8398]|uniref:GATA-type domain-containing protein n=1 Tax=Kwoniella heveanensis BCC8398 TaxID=1296120 RepID=A0A1B9GKC5_9TREE|nr:hypothetical protein I316_06902 [Kwoniella heveanensis BCC8398]
MAWPPPIPPVEGSSLFSSPAAPQHQHLHHQSQHHQHQHHYHHHHNNHHYHNHQDLYSSSNGESSAQGAQQSHHHGYGQYQPSHEMSYSSGYPFHITASDDNATAGPSHSYNQTPTHHNIPLSSPLEYPLTGGTTCLGPGPAGSSTLPAGQGPAPSTWIPQSNTLPISLNSHSDSQSEQQLPHVQLSATRIPSYNWNEPPGHWTPFPNINHIPPPAETGLPLGTGATAGKGKNRSEGMANIVSASGGGLEFVVGSGIGYAEGEGGEDEWMSEELGSVSKKRLLGQMDVVDVGRETAQLRTILDELISLLQPFVPSAPHPATSPPPPFLHTRFARLSTLVLQALQTLSPHVHPTLAPGFVLPSNLVKSTDQQNAEGHGQKQGSGVNKSSKSLEEMTPAEREMEVIRKRRDALIAKAAAAAAAAAAASAGPGPGASAGASTSAGAAPRGAGGSNVNGASKSAAANAGGARGGAKGNTASASPKIHPPKSNYLQSQSQGQGHGRQPSPHSPLAAPTAIHHDQNQSYPYDSLSIQQSQQQRHQQRRPSPLGNLAALTEASDLVSHSNSSNTAGSHFDPFGGSSDGIETRANGDSIASGNGAAHNVEGDIGVGAGDPFDFIHSINLDLSGFNHPGTNGNGNGNEMMDGYGNGNGNGNDYRGNGEKSASGRCHGCGSNVTSEWMRGPDGPGSLCDSCGIHYAKLIAKKDIPTPSTTILRPHQLLQQQHQNHHHQQQQEHQYFTFHSNSNPASDQTHNNNHHHNHNHNFPFDPTMNYFFSPASASLDINVTANVDDIILQNNDMTTSDGNSDSNGGGVKVGDGTIGTGIEDRNGLKENTYNARSRSSLTT